MRNVGLPSVEVAIKTTNASSKRRYGSELNNPDHRVILEMWKKVH